MHLWKVLFFFSFNVSFVLLASSLLISRDSPCCPWPCLHRSWCAPWMSSFAVSIAWLRYENSVFHKENLLPNAMLLYLTSFSKMASFLRANNVSVCVSGYTGTPLHEDKDPGWLLLLCVWSPGATEGSCSVLCRDGSGYDHHHTVHKQNSCLHWSHFLVRYKLHFWLRQTPRLYVTWTCLYDLSQPLGMCESSWTMTWTCGSGSILAQFCVGFWACRSGSLMCGLGMLV